MNFKTKRQSDELGELFKHNRKLREVLFLLDGFTQLEFNKPITITDLYRTQAEHEALYAQTPPDKRPKSSPHMFWNAADIRSSDFTAEQQKRMVTFLNCFTYASGQGRPVAMVHTVAGNAQHFHIQCN